MHSAVQRFLNVLRLLGLLFFGAFLVTLRYILRTPQPLQSVLPGESRLYRWTRGHVFYKMLGKADAPPLVLLHAPEVGASSYEMRSLMKELAQQYRVYALDLLGFGLSDRPKGDYSAEMYITLYQDFLTKVVARPATLLASGLSCNYCVAIAASMPDLCERLVLLSPLSLFKGGERRLPQLLQSPLIGMVVYSFLTIRFVLRWVIAQQHAINHTQVTSDELDYAFAAAHQLGAQHAAIAFISGALTLDVSQQFEALQQPTLIIWGASALNGTQHMMSRYSRYLQQHVSAHTQVTLVRDASICVHEERPTAVVATILEWQPEEKAVEVPVNAGVSTATLATTGPTRVKPGEPEESHAAEIESEQEDEARTVEAYCVKCRYKRFMQDPREVVTKKGRRAMEGTCPICGTKLFRFIAS